MNNQHLTIRAYLDADQKKLSSIWLEASLNAHPFLGRQRLLEQQKLIENIYLPQAETWVACSGDEPVGFIGLIDTFIGGLFVAPSRQGEGIGKALVAYALRLKGELSLDVYAHNESAHRFYIGQRFKEISQNPVDNEGLPFPIIRMHRSL